MKGETDEWKNQVNTIKIALNAKPIFYGFQIKRGGIILVQQTQNWLDVLNVDVYKQSNMKRYMM